LSFLCTIFLLSYEDDDDNTSTKVSRLQMEIFILYAREKYHKKCKNSIYVI
jgi:hypothetical protein